MEPTKIIHQIWSNKSCEYPKIMESFTMSWKSDYPDWHYIMWNDEMIIDFVDKEYPELSDMFRRFPFDVQRWDAVRYLILYKMGGLYVDTDYESLKSLVPLLEGQSCCFSMEPDTHVYSHKHIHEQVFNNALIYSEPDNWFMKKIIDEVFSEVTFIHSVEDKYECVLETTGPWRLVDLYDNLLPDERDKIFLIPAKYVTPFDIPQVIRLRQGERSEELENCLDEAYAVHYFFGSWM